MIFIKCFKKFPFLNWEYRKKIILEELNELNADIICLQEFERDQSFIEELMSKGYEVFNL